MKTYESYIQEIDLQVQGIIARSQAYMPFIDEEKIHADLWLAYEFAKEAHKGVTRLSGEPYIAHPVAAAEILLVLSPDIPTLQACFLHDVIEDTDFSYDDILKVFGEEVANLCAGMEKLEKIKYRGEERAIGSLRKMFLAMAEDLRVVFIKLADRLHNMQTLEFHPKPEKRIRIAQETLNIYIPIAARLGLFSIKNALEEQCFKNIHPGEYETLHRDLQELEESRNAFGNSAIIEMQNLLTELDIPYRVDFRVKSSYSIYKKMLKKSLQHPRELYDIYGVRIIVQNVPDCYRVLGQIHGKWYTLPYRFKDYIALPKPNGYESLHTTIIGFLKDYRKQPTEIQIRTEEMHRRAEIGIASHFEYKEGGGGGIAHEIDWVHELKDVMDSVGNNDLMTSLRVDTFKDRIFVFTPKGDLINLPQGSTVIDFAYQVHSDLGNHIVIAKVNGSVYPFDKDLHNGDVIDIIVDKTRKPSPFWLAFVKTMKAKNAIKSYLKKGDKEAYRDRGKEILNQYLEKTGLAKLDKDLTVLKNLDDRTLSTEERLQVLEQIGNFSITPASVLKKIFKHKNISYKKIPKSSQKTHVSHEHTQRGEGEIVIGGETGLSYKRCKNCCKKHLPEQIVAHINSRGQFTIHDRKCSILNGVNKDRLLYAYVKGDESTALFRVSLLLENKIGMMKTVSETLYQMEINIDELHTKKTSASTTLLTIGLEIPDYDYLIIDRFLERIRNQLAHNLYNIKIEHIQKN